MKALRRVARLLYNFPYIMLAILIIGLVIRLVGVTCIVTSSQDSSDDIKTASIGVLANSNQWVDSGLSVDATSQITLSTMGSVFLCPSETYTLNWSVSANNTQWVDTGVNLLNGDLLQIQPGATSTEPGKMGCEASKSPSDNIFTFRNSGSDCAKTNGGLLGAMVIDASINPNTSTSVAEGYVSSDASELAKGITSTTFSAANDSTSTTGATVTQYGGFYGYVNKSGKLWLRGMDVTNYDDNRGGYSGTITTTPNNGCMASNGVRSTTPGYTNYGNIQVAVASGNPATTAYHDISPSSGQIPDNPAYYAPSSGHIWLRINDGNYGDNSASYSIALSTSTPKSPDSFVSAVLMDLFITPIRTALHNALPPIYKTLIQDTHFIKAIRAALTLYIILYCIMFTIGMVHASQLDLAIRVIKIGTVLTLISPQSWDFFNDKLFVVFTEGGMWLLNSITGAVGSPNNPFLFLDKTLGLLFNADTPMKLIGLAMTMPLGLVYFLLILDALLVYVQAVCRSILGFMLSFIAVTMLLTMAPFFISFILFDSTKELFMKWINLLFRYTMEPIILILGLIVINELLVITFQGIISMNVCWKCAIGFTIPGYGNLFCLEFWMPWGYDNDGNGYNLVSSTTILFTNILIFEMLTKLLKEYIDFAPRIAAKLTTTSPVSGTNFVGAGSVSAKAEEGAAEAARSLVGKDKKSMARRSHQEGVDKNAKAELENEAKAGDDATGDEAPTST